MTSTIYGISIPSQPTALLTHEMSRLIIPITPLTKPSKIPRPVFTKLLKPVVIASTTLVWNHAPAPAKIPTMPSHRPEKNPPTAVHIVLKPVCTGTIMLTLNHSLTALQVVFTFVQAFVKKVAILVPRLQKKVDTGIMTVVLNHSATVDATSLTFSHIFTKNALISSQCATIATPAPMIAATSRAIGFAVKIAIAPPIAMIPSSIATRFSVLKPLSTTSLNPTANRPRPPTIRPIAAPTAPKEIARPPTINPIPVSIPMRFSQLTPLFHASNPLVTSRTAPEIASTAVLMAFRLSVNREATFHAKNPVPTAIARFLINVR